LGCSFTSSKILGRKEFPPDEKYAILRKKKIFLKFLLLEPELLIEIGWLYLSNVNVWN
jgi:hypothetical protein